jgi:diaminohydroxyphosphoribosylaminopyrimidine deaminase/5-amino-6-(5-phosphoribosylamino)uracil reductase
MKRCLELAAKGMGKVSPNPMVGAVIVHEGKIIGEGFHTAYGKPHAEVEAIRSVTDKKLLSSSTLYVNLEPCSHFGKTPPCADLILENKIPQVIICNQDPNPLVAGNGIKRLKENGVNVIQGILEEKGAYLNRRFFTFHSKKRPYIILKWAETKDGFIDKIRENGIPKINKISSEESHQLSHQWRSEEDAILVGKNTVLNDNPKLTTRLFEGKSPIRILLDKDLLIPNDSNIYNPESTVIVLNSVKEEKKANIHFHKMNHSPISITEIINFLHSENILSVIIEGGTFTLQSFIDSGIWDEARIFTSNMEFGNGKKAPELSRNSGTKIKSGKDELTLIYHS